MGQEIQGPAIPAGVCFSFLWNSMYKDLKGKRQYLEALVSPDLSTPHL